MIIALLYMKPRLEAERCVVPLYMYRTAVTAGLGRSCLHKRDTAAFPPSYPRARNVRLHLGPPAFPPSHLHNLMHRKRNCTYKHSGLADCLSSVRFRSLPPLHRFPHVPFSRSLFYLGPTSVGG